MPREEQPHGDNTSYSPPIEDVVAEQQRIQASEGEASTQKAEKNQVQRAVGQAAAKDLQKNTVPHGQEPKPWTEDK